MLTGRLPRDTFDGAGTGLSTLSTLGAGWDVALPPSLAKRFKRIYHQLCRARRTFSASLNSSDMMNV
jgi:hypothetical protein